jgi:diphthamide biosynthesis protein 3
MSIYEEIEIEDMDYDPIEYMYTYPCPCGDKFCILLEELWDGEDIAKCPSCTLRIMVIFDEEDLPELPPEDDEDDEGQQAEETSHDKESESTGLESKVEALAVKG